MIKFAALVAFGLVLECISILVTNAKKLICCGAVVALLCGVSLIPTVIATSVAVGTVRICRTVSLSAATPLSLILLAVLAPLVGATEIMAQGAVVAGTLALFTIACIVFKRGNPVGDKLIRFMNISGVAILAMALAIPYAVHIAFALVAVYSVITILIGVSVALMISYAVKQLAAPVAKGGYIYA